MSTPPEIEPDAKDWTWVLERPCPECGLDAGAVDRADLGPLILENAATWAEVLAHPSATRRPAPAVWSPTEYAAHVRDVHRVMGARLRMMLAQDDPTFENWDQDDTAVADRYDLQQPGQVAAELTAAAEDVAAAYDGVAVEEWGRGGTRSNGSVFTVESLGRYHLHDVVHHLWDVRWVESS